MVASVYCLLRQCSIRVSRLETQHSTRHSSPLKVLFFHLVFENLTDLIVIVGVLACIDNPACHMVV